MDDKTISILSQGEKGWDRSIACFPSFLEYSYRRKTVAFHFHAPLCALCASGVKKAEQTKTTETQRKSFLTAYFHPGHALTSVAIRRLFPNLASGAYVATVVRR